MTGALIVRVSKDKWASVLEQKQCRWLGHSSYKCAACKLGYLKVKTLDEHDEKCADCGVFVFVARDYEESKRFF